MEDKTNIKKGRVKMHVELQCWMGQWPYILKGYERHVAHCHGERYGIWWYDQGRWEPRWKALLI
jgi:hypothetical protein